MRHIIKRNHVVDRADAAVEPRRTPSNTPIREPGVELVELEPGRHAIRHTCRCGETTVLEVEIGSAPQENQA